MRVDRDAAVVGDRDAHALQAQALGARPAADRDHQPLGLHRVPGGHVHAHADARCLRPRRLGAEADVDPVVREQLGQQVANRRGLARQQPRRRLDQRLPAPKRASICASSIPTGPPPSTIALSGTASSAVASRLVQ